MESKNIINSEKKLNKIMDKPIESRNKPQTSKKNLNSPNLNEAKKMEIPSIKLVPQIPLSLNILNKEYDYYQKAKCSNKQLYSLKSYSYNTYHGLSKDNNEDRIIVVSQIKKPAFAKIKNWPKMSYFGIFDGHGGEGCSEFLSNNFLKYLIENKNFPFDIKLSLVETFDKVEQEFFKQKCNTTLEESDRSGSCGLVSLIYDNKIYIANLGDSRIIMSMNWGDKVKQLSSDHKPNNPKEFERALKNGSKVYIDNSEGKKKDITKLNFIKDKVELEKYKKKENNKEEIIFREYPSNLAVMRAIGDKKKKKKEYGGNPGTIINKPDIYIFDINSSYDFIVMGSDGIFDDLSNQEVSNAAWYIFKKELKEKNYDIHGLTQDACDLIIKYALEKQTLDNLSCIVIGLEGLEKYLRNKINKEKVNNCFKKNYCK